MGGTVAPKEWRGGLKGVAYNIGPQLTGDYKLRLSTHNYIKQQRSYNVIGTVKGSVEPGEGKIGVKSSYDSLG